MRSATPRLLAALLAIALVPSAAAHNVIPDPITGTVVAPAGESAILEIAHLHGRDTLWVEYKVAEAGATAPALVRWTDADGATHTSPGHGATSHAEFRFVAPPGLTAATVEIANLGDAPIEVGYAYLGTAPFWRSPDLWLPTVAPFLFLAASLLVAWLLKPYILRRGTGPVRPPGWEEAQARKQAQDARRGSRSNQDHQEMKSNEA